MPKRNKSIPLNISQMFAQFPRRHLVLASSLLATLFLGLMLTPGDDAQATRNTIPLSLSLTPAPSIEVQTIAEPAAPEPATPWQQFEVRSGDTLSTIFKRAGLSARDVHEVVHSSEKTKALRKIFPGQTIAFHVDNDGTLQALKHIKDRLNTTFYQRDGDQFISDDLAEEPEIRQRFATGSINSSLFLAAQAAELPVNLTMELANIYGGVIDFVYDIRRGDSFVVLFEEKFLDGEKIGNGNILAAQFMTQGEVYNAYRYVYENGEVGYYNENGESMRKAFLRAPLDFTRISSGFNPSRLHPVFKTRRPHRGIDYAAPRGTPVYAAGDGRVTKSGYSKANGNYVFIRHGQQYVTKYLHLNKRAVRGGQRVKQRQIIGWVGSTGYATGPHLHYEFLLNGVHRNPRTILKKLPKAESIAANEKSRFLQQISGLQLQLATYAGNRQYASADDMRDENKTL